MRIRNSSRWWLRCRRRRRESIGGARGGAALLPPAALTRTRAAALRAPLARSLSGLQFAALRRPPARLTCARRTQKSSEREAQERRRPFRGARERDRRPAWPRQRAVDLTYPISYILKNHYCFLGLYSIHIAILDHLLIFVVLSSKAFFLLIVSDLVVLSFSYHAPRYINSLNNLLISYYFPICL